MTTNPEAVPTRSKAGVAFGRIIDFTVAAVRIVAAIFAVILVAYIVLFVFEADPANPLTGLVTDLSSSLTLWFDGLFTPDDPKIGIVVNYGLAAVFWLVAGAIVARLLRTVR